MSKGENRPGFIGLFIPAEIWERKDIRPIERVLWAEIAALYRGGLEMGRPGCFKSNAGFAESYGVSVNTVKAMMKRLRDAGLIETVHFDGRIRYLKAVIPVDSQESCPVAGQETVPADSQETVPHKEKSKENINTEEDSPGKVEKKRSESKEIIDYFHDSFLKKVGSKPTVKGAQWTVCIKKLLANHNKDFIKKHIDFFFAWDQREVVSFDAWYGGFDNLVLKMKKNGTHAESKRQAGEPFEEYQERLKRQEVSA